MIFDSTGEITPNLYMLGHACVPVFLLDDGVRPVLIDSGFSIMGDRLVGEIRAILRKRVPAFLLLTHSHFDHCGGAGVLKSAFPGMKIVASSRANAILQKPKALELIGDLSQEALPLAPGLGLSADNLPQFLPFSVDHTVLEGDVIPLERNLSILTLETPGHTRDSLSFFLPEKKILFCAESLGIPDATGYIISECLSEYDQYAASMLKLKALKPDILCLGHYKVFTGQDARRYIDDSLAHCQAFKNRVATYLAEEAGDMNRVMRRFKRLEYDGKRENAHPEAAYLINLTARIRAVLASVKQTALSE